MFLTKKEGRAMVFFKWALFVVLSMNVVATGMDVYKINPEFMDWINLIGCVVFGAYCNGVFAKT